MTKKKPGKRGIEKIIVIRSHYAAVKQIDGWTGKTSWVNVLTGVVELTLEKVGNTAAMP